MMGPHLPTSAPAFQFDNLQTAAKLPLCNQHNKRPGQHNKRLKLKRVECPTEKTMRRVTQQMQLLGPTLLLLPI
jgi:hypothetical protein